MTVATSHLIKLGVFSNIPLVYNYHNYHIEINKIRTIKHSQKFEDTKRVIRSRKLTKGKRQEDLQNTAQKTKG